MSSTSSLSVSTEKSQSFHPSPALSQLQDEQKRSPPDSAAVTRDENHQIKSQTSGDPFLVKWDPGDRDNPYDWSTGYKSWVTFQFSMLALAPSLASSVTAPANTAIAEYTRISEEVAALSISLFVLGFAFGPLIWAPISEIWGRRWSLLPAMLGLALFSIGTAISKNAAAIFITRFFAGLFGSGPVSNVSAALGDIWRPKARGVAMTFYSACVVGGPTLGPVIGGALTVSKNLGWRWTEYLIAIFTFGIFGICLLLLPEVYGPYLMKRKAQRVRKETGDSRYYHPHENIKIDIKSMLTKHFARPILMLTTEPMVTCICFYASFVFALLYATLEVFPIVFVDHRHWALVPSTLPFLAMFVGVLFALLINLANQPRYRRISEAANGRPVPEARIAPMKVGGLLFAIGLFWFGWTASSEVPWPAPVVSAGFIGAGFNVVFQQCLNYLVDTYGMYAASATSANTFLRSLMGCGLPLVARPMFNSLGVGPAMSLLGGVATLMLPVPFVLLRIGLTLRRRSKFAPVLD